MMNATEQQETSRAADGDAPRSDGNAVRSRNAPAQERPVEQSPRGDQPRDGNPRDGNPRDGQPAPDRQHNHAAEMENPIPPDLKKPSGITVLIMTVLFVALMAGFFILGWVPRHRLAEQTNSDAAAEESQGPPVVIVEHPRPLVAAKDVTLPCDVKANQQTAIYSRSNGFLKQWFFDIGAHVEKGQLLAVIEAPDVDAQLAQAQATLQSANATVVKSQADAEVAQTDYDRYLKTQHDNPGSVTQEDVDTKRAAAADAVGALDVAKASVVQQQAVVQQLNVSQGFEKLVAPFAGTITARNYDVGALISPTNTAAGAELFDIADTQTLRVFVNVPQNYSTQVHIGDAAYLSVRNYPQKEFVGVVARMTDALDLTTRTLPFELDFNNKDGFLFAGMYGEARLQVTEQQPTLVIKSSALIFDAQGSQVAMVHDDKVHFQKITVNRDLGTELEVTNGLSADDQVIVNPGARLVEGAEVKVNTAPAQTPQTASAK